MILSYKISKSRNILRKALEDTSRETYFRLSGLPGEILILSLGREIKPKTAVVIDNSRKLFKKDYRKRFQTLDTEEILLHPTKFPLDGMKRAYCLDALTWEESGLELPYFESGSEGTIVKVHPLLHWYPDDILKGVLFIGKCGEKFLDFYNSCWSEQGWRLHHINQERINTEMNERDRQDVIEHLKSLGYM